MRSAKSFLVAATALLALVTMAVAPASARSDSFGEYTPTLVVLDVSGSMNRAAFAGATESRLEVAKRGVQRLIDGMEDGSTYGLLAYPGVGSELVDGCRIGRVQTELGPLDRVAAASDVRRMVADGDTPTGPALEHAAEVLTRGGQNSGTIILLTDGDANCGNKDVCEVVAGITARGLDVHVSPIGIDLSNEAREQMACVAQVTGGTFHALDDASDVEKYLEEAGRAVLDISVDAPTEILLAPGAREANAIFEATVRVPGDIDAKDVRLTLQVQPRSSRALPVVIPRPVHHVGNVRAGESITARIGALAVDPDQLGTMTWRMVATAANALPVQLSGTANVNDLLSPDALGPIFDGVDNVVILGDSYSSGEGARNRGEKKADAYDDVTPVACHRSKYAYGRVLWGAETTIIACSGAVTADFYNPQTKLLKSTPSQLRTLREAALGPTPPDAVVLSIGGNDAGFGWVVKRCIVTIGCVPWKIGATPEGDLTRRATEITGDVQRVLEHVDQAVNDAQALANRGGKVAPIIVLPYPRIIPADARRTYHAPVSSGGSGQVPEYHPDPVYGVDVPDFDPLSGCMVDLDADELEQLNGFFDTLNLAIRAPVHHLQSRNRPVYLVEDVIESFQPDHTICDDKSFAVTTKNLGGLTKGVELLHPNVPGHETMARAIAGWSNGPGARPITAGTADPFEVLDRADGNRQMLQEWTTRNLQPGLGSALPPELRPINGSVRVNESGFEPGSDVLVRLYSTPTLLGGLIADDDGAVDEVVGVPDYLPAGSHTLEVFGWDPDGEVLIITHEVVVLPKGGFWLYVIIGGGVGAVVLGLIVRWVSVRKQRRAATEEI